MEATVFLSHAGADTAEADRLRKRLEEAGFKVWFDKRDLRPGREAWQKQIEDKIDQVDAFVVYVGSRGVVNWVEAETRYALSRAISGKHKLAFVPVLSPDVEKASKALPGFARQFQAVRDPLNDPLAWNKLVDGLTTGAPPPAEKEPFFGLDPITHDRSHLFFGRRNEIGKIVDILADRNLLLVLGDSGAGKSSLVRAGLVPAWQGNEIGVRRGEHPGERDWLTITMTPGDDPWGNLAEAVRGAAESERGLSATAAAEYSDLAKRDDPSHKMRAMRLNADPNQARVLLVLDQFEELFVRKAISTETRRSFAAFLAELANPTDPRFAVALTMRGDYSNYLNEPEVAPLKERIDAKEARARYYLRSILQTDPDGKDTKKTGADRLREVVTGPLALARVPEDEANALADLVLRDTGGAPSDLALVQFALSETWVASGGKEAPDPSKLNLLGAYVAVGRVEGALAKAADKAVNSLIQADIATEEDVWAALIRLGSLEGASPLRRTALRAEFTDSRWTAIQYLASQEGRRLVHISGEGDHATAEIAHEALLTQWGRLNQLLSHNSEDKRLLDRFVLRAWEAKEGQKPPQRTGRLRAFLRTAALQSPDPDEAVLSADDAKRFERLETDRQDWLTEAEVALLRRSRDHAVAMRRQEAWRPKVMLVAVVVLAGLLAGVGSLWLESRAEQARAQKNEISWIIALSLAAAEKNDAQRAVSLALLAAELESRNGEIDQAIEAINRVVELAEVSTIKRVQLSEDLMMEGDAAELESRNYRDGTQAFIASAGSAGSVEYKFVNGEIVRGDVIGPSGGPEVAMIASQIELVDATWSQDGETGYTSFTLYLDDNVTSIIRSFHREDPAASTLVFEKEGFSSDGIHPTRDGSLIVQGYGEVITISPTGKHSSVPLSEGEALVDVCSHTGAMLIGENGSDGWKSLRMRGQANDGVFIPVRELDIRLATLSDDCDYIALGYQDNQILVSAIGLQMAPSTLPPAKGMNIDIAISVEGSVVASIEHGRRVNLSSFSGGASFSVVFGASEDRISVSSYLASSVFSSNGSVLAVYETSGTIHFLDVFRPRGEQRISFLCDWLDSRKSLSEHEDIAASRETQICNAAQRSVLLPPLLAQPIQPEATP